VTPVTAPVHETGERVVGAISPRPVRRAVGDRGARELFAVALTAALTSAVVEGLNARSVIDTIEVALVVLAVASVIPLRHRILAATRMPPELVDQHDRVIVSETSHQLRTPITIARGHAELLRPAVAGSGESDLHLDIILEELDRMTRLTERMLVLTSAGDDTFLVRAPVAVDALCVEIAERWRAAASRAWRVDCLDDTTAFLDAPRLVMAIDALVENAVQHTSTGDEIRIGATCTGGEAVLSVRDFGRGMTDEELRSLHLALDNVQPDGDKVGPGGDTIARSDGPRRQGGTGLGLRIAAAITAAHGGYLTVSGRRGFGCTFRIHVPLDLAEPQPQSDSQARIVSGVASSALSAQHGALHGGRALHEGPAFH
jgi:signal transduction histidine kinase